MLGELPVLRCKCLRSACGVRSVVKVQVVPVPREVRRDCGLEEGASAVQEQQALRSPEVSLELPVRRCKCSLLEEESPRSPL